MKKLLLLLAVLPAIFQSSFAQWLPSGATSGPITYSGGNVGIGSANPALALQVGEFGIGSSNSQLLIPGSYNFEQLRLGQTGNGNSALEFINHTGLNSSYGIKFLVNVDSGSPGLQFQYAPSAGGYGSLTYATALFMDLTGKIGIGTITPGAKLDVSGAAHVSAGSFTSIYSDNTDGAYPSNYINNTAGASQLSIGSNYTSGQLDLSLVNSNLAGGGFSFYQLTGTNSKAALMRITAAGNVGIGTTSPDALLAVKGTIHTQEVKVDMTGWNDYVFNSTYKLPRLSEVKTFIDKNHHLPDMPSEKEVVDNGIQLTEMLKLQQKKIEELTLYLIREKARNDKQEKINRQMLKLISQLQKKH